MKKNGLGQEKYENLTHQQGWLLILWNLISPKVNTLQFSNTYIYIYIALFFSMVDTYTDQFGGLDFKRSQHGSGMSGRSQVSPLSH